MQNRYDFILNVVREAGSMVVSHKDQNIQVDFKNDDPMDLVTKVDLEVSAFLVKKINENFPNELVYSEESPDIDISSGSFWSVDPIDGTTNFSRHIPHYSVVITYIENGVPVVGAIFNPMTNELYSFKKGEGAFLNGNQIKVSNIKKLDQSFILLRAGRDETLWNWGAEAYKFMLQKGVKCSNFGSSALDTCFVASGKIEANIYGTLTTVDIAAAMGLLIEAGGKIYGKGGKEVNVLSKERQQVIVVNNEEILEQLKPILI